LNSLKRFYKGEIVSIDDPKKLWRIKVDIKGLFSTPNGEQSIDISELPYIYPMNNGFNNGETPKVGQSVLVEFDGDIRRGRYRSWEEMSEEFLILLQDDYEGYKSIVFDDEEKLNIRYTRSKGVEVILDKSFIQIERNGTIRGSFNEGQRKIELNDKGVSIVSDKIFHGSLDNASQPSVLGDDNKEQIDALWDAINKILNILENYADVQSKISRGILSPLKIGLKLLGKLSKAEISPNNKMKAKTPKTLSKVNKLD
jgi:hypothetical protein